MKKNKLSNQSTEDNFMNLFLKNRSDARKRIFKGNHDTIIYVCSEIEGLIIERINRVRDPNYDVKCPYSYLINDKFKYVNTMLEEMKNFHDSYPTYSENYYYDEALDVVNKVEEKLTCKWCRSQW